MIRACQTTCVPVPSARSTRPPAGTGSTMTNPRAGRVDEGEIARFSAIAEEWWNPLGPLAPLHRLNPIRLGFIQEWLCRQFGRDANTAAPLAGLRILDVGCGGGLVCEPLRRLGADMVGI